MAKSLKLSNQHFTELTFQKAPQNLSKVLDIATGHYKAPKRHIMLSYFKLEKNEYTDIFDDMDYKEWLMEEGNSIVISVKLPEKYVLAANKQVVFGAQMFKKKVYSMLDSQTAPSVTSQEENKIQSQKSELAKEETESPGLDSLIQEELSYNLSPKETSISPRRATKTGPQKKTVQFEKAEPKQPAKKQPSPLPSPTKSKPSPLAKQTPPPPIKTTPSPSPKQSAPTPIKSKPSPSTKQSSPSPVQRIEKPKASPNLAKDTKDTGRFSPWEAQQTSPEPITIKEIAQKPTAVRNQVKQRLNTNVHTSYIQKKSNLVDKVDDTPKKEDKKVPTPVAKQKTPSPAKTPNPPKKEESKPIPKKTTPPPAKLPEKSLELGKKLVKDQLKAPTRKQNAALTSGIEKILRNEMNKPAKEEKPDTPEPKLPPRLDSIPEFPREKLNPPSKVKEAAPEVTPKIQAAYKPTSEILSDDLVSLASQSSLSVTEFTSIQRFEVSPSKEEEKQGPKSILKQVVPQTSEFEDSICLGWGNPNRIRVKEALCLLESIGYEELDISIAKFVMKHAYPGTNAKPVLDALAKTGFIAITLQNTILFQEKSQEALHPGQQIAIVAATLELFPFIEDEIETYETSEANYELAMTVLDNPLLKSISAFRLDLLMRVGEFKYNMKGLPEEAIGHFKEAVELSQTIYPDMSKNSKAAAAHQNLAKCYITTWDLGKSADHILTSLKIKTNIYGENHAETASAIHYMGNALLAQKRVEEAIEWHEKAAYLRSETLGADSVEVSLSLAMLASDYLQIGDMEKAHEIQVQTKKIRKAALSPDHPKLADIYFNLSSTWLAMNDVQKGEKYIVRAYEIRKKVFGEDHYSVAACRVNIAQIFLTTKCYQEAMKSIQLATKVFLDQFGENHPYTRTAFVIQNRLENKFKELGLKNPYAQPEDEDEVAALKSSSCCEIF